MVVRSYFLLGACLLMGLSEAMANVHRRKHGGAAEPFTLKVEFLPVEDRDGTVSLSEGKPIVNYIPENAVVDRYDRVEVRTRLLLRTRPWVRHRYLGRLVSDKGDITFLPSARIVTDGKGRFHVTLRSLLNHNKTWDFSIRPAPGQDYDIEWDDD